MFPNHTTAATHCSHDLVSVRNNQVVTSSLQVAKIFGKDHADVLKSIRKLDCSPNFIAGNFTSYHYFSKLNKNVTRKLPMYYMTRDGFTFLVMGFTGKIAAQFKEAYIEAFNEMERKLREDYVPKSTVATAEKRTSYWKHRAESLMDSNEKLSKSILLLAQDQQAPIELRPKKFYRLTPEYYTCAVRSFVAWLNWENTGCFASDIRDKHLVKRLEATRLLFDDYTRPVPVGAVFGTL